MIFRGQDGADNKTGLNKVVAMDRFRTRSNVSPLRQAEAYWTALRRGDDIPSRSQVDPRGLENILSQTFILERVAPGIARFRLAGQKVNELAGMEVRGMPLTAFFTADARKTLSAALEHMFDDPSILEFDLKTEATRLRGSRTARMILLPLRSDLGDVSRALGVLVSDGGASRVSQRFLVEDYEIRKIGKSDAATASPAFKATPRVTAPGLEDLPRRDLSAKTPSETDGFAEPRAGFERKSTSLMEEARSLLDRARRENSDVLKATRPMGQEGAGRKGPATLETVSTTDAEKLVSRPPRGGKLKKDAPHLRLVVSRD
ncbi:PAS domain-containing protein [Epibacterium sp. Ofav1-8]|uniref:PAS domain-containing protein n=1 Tax=Epibacterium sp. Ofav1-8 TaxID=2917735 RepID=UPI001EF4C1BF|nr:PAS domain-containing protein [Epibacterium sp. Ofav1-8]MCG7622702.1 PAS domain-containing protein [Epibacterium sp. Ofav1-8]